MVHAVKISLLPEFIPCTLRALRDGLHLGQFLPKCHHLNNDPGRCCRGKIKTLPIRPHIVTCVICIVIQACCENTLKKCCSLLFCCNSNTFRNMNAGKWALWIRAQYNFTWNEFNVNVSSQVLSLRFGPFFCKLYTLKGCDTCCWALRHLFI